MALFALDGRAPKLESSAWVAPDAAVIGDVVLEAAASVWFSAVLRGDNETILVGERTNVQDGCVFHTDLGYPLTIGQGCTVGHKAILHGCRVGENTLIGMASTVLTGAVIGRNCIIGANALVPEGRNIPDGSLVLGVPAKIVRQITPEEIEAIRASARHYAENARRFAIGLAAL
jgi:carbonic anhydrase/acetyltransferase-like protein (isoleucine patch superfamily)